MTGAFTCRALESLWPEEEKCDFQIRAQTGFCLLASGTHHNAIVLQRVARESHVSNTGQPVLGKPEGVTHGGDHRPQFLFSKEPTFGRVMEGEWGEKEILRLL